MKTFDVRGIQIDVPFAAAVGYIADAANLPAWAQAFRTTGHGRAALATPAGAVDVDLAVEVSTLHGSIDWIMTFPDGSVARAFSRVVPLDARSVVYTFVLTAPPVPLEQLEGTLAQQAQTLHEELERLKEILETR